MVVVVEVFAVVHRSGGYYSYDVFYRFRRDEEEDIAEAVESLRNVDLGVGIIRVKIGKECDFPDYKMSACPVVQHYKARGWKYLCSGDTDHIDTTLSHMGLKSPDDLSGLVEYLKSRYMADRVYMVEVGDDGRVVGEKVLYDRFFEKKPGGRIVGLYKTYVEKGGE